MAEWTTLPHGPLERLAENLWRVEGALPRGPLKRVMTVARRDDGKLLVHSAIALQPAAQAQLEALGELAFLVVPNGFHRLDAPRYKARYPALRVYCPRGSRARVAEVVQVDGAYEDYPRDSSTSLAYVDGVSDAEGLLHVRSQDGATLVLNDLVFDMPHEHGLQGFVLRHVMDSSGGPRLSRLCRLFLVKDKAKLRVALQALADTPELVRIVVSHHQLIAERPAEILRTLATTV
jgi:hypothetical protein